MIDENKQKTLAEFLDIDIDEMDTIEYDEDNIYSTGLKEYLVLTDDEADTAAKDYIRDSLWSFDAGFLDYYIDVLNKNQIEKIQEVLYEDCNETLYKLVDNFDDLVDRAISIDGREHFLATYDGHENEVNNYFIYRTN